MFRHRFLDVLLGCIFDGLDDALFFAALAGGCDAQGVDGKGEGGAFLRRLEDLEDFGKGWLDLVFFTGVDGIGGKVWRLEDLVVLPDASDEGTLGDAALP